MDIVKTQTLAVGTLSDVKAKEIFVTGLLVLIPLVWSGPQLVVGSFVNMLLCLAARTSRPNSWLIKAALPSLAVIIHGVLFNSFTIYLFYLWPVIAIGNLIYMKIGQGKSDINKWAKLPVAAGVKMLVLMSGAVVMAHFKIIPLALVSSMGVIQFATAMIGGLMAFLWIKY
jgi:hypothetical protein